MKQDKIHILLVEDERAHVKLIRRAFADNAEQVTLAVATTLSEAKTHLAKSTPHMVIADLNLPDGRATELLPPDKNAPPYALIIMTGQGDERVAVEAMKGGAFDYVVKSEESLSAMPTVMKSVLREWRKVLTAKEDAEKAKETAERASKAKSEFLSRMSHELRTPMNAILGFGQLLEMDTKEPLSPKQKSKVEYILKAGNHLLALINELLDLSRIESGETALSFEDVNVNRVLRDLFALVKPLADEKNIKFINKLTGGPECFIWADVTRFKQVMLNLLSNAIKYNREGGSITLAREKASTGRVHISVRDTGVGISEEKFEAVFEPFSRLGMESTVTEGTGIGLTITKRLANLMDGSVKVKSVVGEGSCFTVDFPMGKLHAGMEKEPPTETSSEKTEYTALYIEDNPDNLALVRELLLNRPKIKLLSAPQAELGIDLAKAHQPDLILMDLNLPGMDGMEALKRLQSLAATKNIPVIALSANASEHDIKSALAAGFTDYITKPINVPEFYDKVDKYFK